MDNTRGNQNSPQGGPPEGSGYSEPGRDEILQSNQPTVPSPKETANQRLTTPDSYIKSINEKPGDANPALNETAGEEQGTMSTADMLRAREGAEEQYMRRAQEQMYQDQPRDTNDAQFNRTDTGQPDYPFKYQETATPQQLDSVELQEDFEGMDQGIGSMDLRARAEAMMDRDGPETVYTDALHGEGPYGQKARELDIEGPEAGGYSVPNEIDEIAPDMKNIPSEG